MEIQPNYPEVADSDKYFAVVASRLAKVWDNLHLMSNVSDELKKRVILAVVGYYQDIIADAGIWRSFSILCEKLYHRPVPFFDRPDDYIDSELNLIDIQFIIWYVVETSSAKHGILSPYDKSLTQLSNAFFNVLDAIYEDAPTPVEYNIAMDVDLHDEEEDNMRSLYDLSYWLFWNSYFMRPAATPTLQQAMSEAQEIIKQHPDTEEAKPLLAELNQRVMMENPTGPLSLSIGEWLEMIVNQRIPDFDDTIVIPDEPHKYYSALVKATGGAPIAFFRTYDELEHFLGNEMGWGEKHNGHLPGLNKFNNFVILGNPAKGILIAHDVAQYINHPNNVAFDPDEAARNGHRLITDYGTAPIDLVKYVFENNLVPDIRLPFDTSGSFLHDNWDFLARLYQQGFYTAD